MDFSLSVRCCVIGTSHAFASELRVSCYTEHSEIRGVRGKGRSFIWFHAQTQTLPLNLPRLNVQDIHTFHVCLLPRRTKTIATKFERLETRANACECKIQNSKVGSHQSCRRNALIPSGRASKFGSTRSKHSFVVKFALKLAC